MATLDGQATDVGNKEIIRGGVLLGLISILPMGLLDAYPKMHYDAAAAHAIIADNYLTYLAFTCLGGILAWATPNAMTAWGRPVRIEALIPLSFISTGISRAFVNLSQKNYEGALVSIGLALAVCGICGLVGLLQKYRAKTAPLSRAAKNAP
jgi:hypothetical protein